MNSHEQIDQLAQLSTENPNPVLRLSHDGIVLYANSASARLLRCWGAALGKRAPEFWRALVREALADGKTRTVDIELEGRVFCLVLAPIVSARYANLYGNDITERKRGEEKLKRLATVVKDSNDAITVQDLEGRITAWNHGAELMYGYGEEEALKMNIGHLTLPTRAAEEKKLVRRLIAGEAIPSFETQRVVKDGRILDVWLTATRLVDETGKPIGIAATARDITERKRTEASLREANFQLNKSLEELKRTQKMVIQHERLAALGQMASGIAHDFNNVLMPIMGLSELMISNPSILNDQKQAIHLIESIFEASKDARHIVRRMKEIYREDDNAEYKPIDISKIVETAISLTMPKWKEEMSAKGATIEIVTDFHPVPNIQGVASELREVVTNLIFNAVDASSKGGTITFRLYCKDSIFVVLEVADTGVGMDQETLRRCMEPFFTTKGVKGTGLGLSMVHGIVTRHGGALGIESKPGAGTTIRMQFPVPVETANAEKYPKKEPKQLRPLRILVIDDEARARNLVARLLKADGHHVETDGGGQEGLDMFRQSEFDLIITDRAMPLMSGDKVAKEAQEIRPGTPIMMLTGFGDIMKDKSDLPAGVARIMAKPVTSQELRHVMASVMRSAGKAKPKGRRPKGQQNP